MEDLLLKISFRKSLYLFDCCYIGSIEEMVKIVELVTDFICMGHVETGSEKILRHLGYALSVVDRRDHRLEDF